MAKIIKVEKSENGNSYQIDFGDSMVLWFDTYKDSDGELTGDWNKYIFYNNNEDDQKIKEFQNANSDDAGAYNYATALELCEQYQEALDRLEYLRGEIEHERISTAEILELESLTQYIEPGDVQLLEWANVPENK